MSRGTIILILVLSGVLVALLFMPSFTADQAPAPVAIAENPVSPGPTTPVTTPDPPPVGRTPPPVPRPSPETTPPRIATAYPATNRPPAPTPQIIPAPGDDVVELDEPAIKPLPELERDYQATTNQETRLDIIMDIAETETAESIRTLARLFELETDAELKVDLIDSLLGYDGFADEKLALLTLGIRQGLPGEVRQSAIDGLIDLEDPRAIPLLNGLLNDPDEEIREAAQDALELVQNPQEIPKLR